MALSNAVPQTAVSKTLGYALDYKDLQTAQGNLPVKILVLSDFDETPRIVVDGTTGEERIENQEEVTARKTAVTESPKVLSATAKEVGEKLGKNSLGYEVMKTLDRLNAKQFIDVLYVDETEEAEEIESAVKAGLGDIWYNIVVNPFGTNPDVYEALRLVNGIPGEDGGSGRWNSLEVKPFVAISGTATTDFADEFEKLNPSDLTNVIGTAPNAFADELATYNKYVVELAAYETAMNKYNTDLAAYEEAAKKYVTDLAAYNAWNELSESEKEGTPEQKEPTEPNEPTMPEEPVIQKEINEEMIEAKIAASYAFLMYKQFSTKPYLDISGKVLPFVSYPKDLEIGKMNDWRERDALAKEGICTVKLDAGMGGYVVQDFITGRRMGDQADTAKDWRWVRDLFVDFNVAYKYQILQNKTLMNRVIVSDDEIILPGRKGDAIRLNVWKAAVINFFEQMVSELFMTDAKFAEESLLVALSATNPKRIDTQFAYKRTSTVNIASTTAYVGFAFGENA